MNLRSPLPCTPEKRPADPSHRPPGHTIQWEYVSYLVCSEVHGPQTFEGPVSARGHVCPRPSRGNAIFVFFFFRGRGARGSCVSCFTG